MASRTVHTVHPFWESFTHDSPAHFDQLAALAVKDADGAYSVTMEETVGVDYTAFHFGKDPLPWRACAPGYQPPNVNKQMGFDSLDVPHARPFRRSGYEHARLRRLPHLQPEHSGPLQLRRPVLREPKLPVATVISGKKLPDLRGPVRRHSLATVGTTASSPNQLRSARLPTLAAAGFAVPWSLPERVWPRRSAAERRLPTRAHRPARCRARTCRGLCNRRRSHPSQSHQRYMIARPPTLVSTMPPAIAVGLLRSSGAGGKGATASLGAEAGATCGAAAGGGGGIGSGGSCAKARAVNEITTIEVSKVG